MGSMWNLDLENVDTTTPTPDEIVNEQCDFLREATQGRIVAKVANYNGPIASYTAPPLVHNFAKALAPLYMSQEQKFDIQDKLGEIGDDPSNYFTFEFFITSMKTPNYKFRIMFLRYGIGHYPVELVLDEDIAINIGMEEPSFSCDSMDEFKDYLAKILNSPKVQTVIKTLYAATLKEEKKSFKYLI